MHYKARISSGDLPVFLIIVAMLTIIGLLFIYSASSIYALERFGSSAYFVKKQAIGLCFAFITFIVMRYMPLHLVQALTPYCLAGSLFFTLLTIIPLAGVTIHGSSRWLSLWGFTSQPSELIKVWLIPYLAHLIAQREHAKGAHTKTFLIVLFVVGICGLILLKQPDFGMAFALVVTSFFMLFIAQLHALYFCISLAALIPLVLVLIAFKPYRLQRILTFLNPWNDPRGSGFQIIQSLIAIGSGGWWGLGLGQSKQKFFYLPMQHTDFIFSIIVEESGFVGALLIIMLYLMLLYVGIRIAWRQPTTFASLMVTGFILLISLQAIIHLGVTTGLLPPKGVGLPLISYGKSSLIATFAMIGLIANAASSTK